MGRIRLCHSSCNLDPRIWLLKQVCSPVGALNMPWASGLSGKRLKIGLAISVFTNAWTGGLEFLATERDHLGGSGRSPRSQGAGQSPLPRRGLVVGSRCAAAPATRLGGKKRAGGAAGDRNPGQECGSAAACTRAGAAFLPAEAQRSGSQERCPPGSLGAGSAGRCCSAPCTRLMCHGRSKAKPVRTPSRLPFPYPGFPPFVPVPLRRARPRPLPAKWR